MLNINSGEKCCVDTTAILEYNTSGRKLKTIISRSRINWNL